MQRLVRPGVDKTPPLLVRSDLRFANDLIAGAMNKCSWSRNKRWALKFANYINNAYPGPAARELFPRLLLSNRLALAFLARVAREKPRAKTRVKSAKRAVNFLRSLGHAPSLDNDPRVRLLSRSFQRSFARTVRQSPALPAIFARAILSRWGRSPVWWHRMVALMVIMALCTMARGAEIAGCRREGVVWVRPDGTQVRADLFSPLADQGPLCPPLFGQVRGFLLLFPARKNHQSTPTWVPVVSAAAVSLLARHLQWLDAYRGPSPGCLFPARRAAGPRWARTFVPTMDPEAAMSVDSFRLILRSALAQCCGLSAAQARQFGTHSLRVGAMELLRSRGVPAEIRQQLGGWMSATSALGYLQLPVAAQFGMLRRIFA